jgi:hypothetical protein
MRDDHRRERGGQQLHTGRREHLVIHTPDWTDANTHDPGITLLQVVAYTLVAAAGVGVFAAWRSRREGVRADWPPRTSG